MHTVEKYANLQDELPKLPKVLLNTIQSEVLEIRKVEKTCEKYSDACSKIPALKDACFVVYSKYIEKANHKYERFIFLDKQGAEICDVSGVDMELYGLLSCTDLSFSEEYKATHKS